MPQEYEQSEAEERDDDSGADNHPPSNGVILINRQGQEVFRQALNPPHERGRGKTAP